VRCHNGVVTTVNQSLRTWIVLAAIVVLGFLLRLYRLDYQSVWFDEAFSITASAKPLAPLTEFLIQRDRHPPLHYYLLHFVFALFGYGALQARVVSLIFGSLSIFVLYLLAKYLFDASTGLLSALLLALSQLGVAYSQEARNYSQLLFLSIISTYFFMVALRERRRLWWWASVVSCILLIYTHYYGVFILLGLFLFAIFYRRRYPIPRFWWAGGIALVALCYGPWLLSGVVQHNLARGRGSIPSGQVSSLSVHWFTLLTTVNWFNNGKLFGLNATFPWWTFLVGGFLFLAPVLLALKPLFKDATPPAAQWQKEALFLLNLLWILPLLLVCAVGLATTAFNIRFAVYLIGFYYILVARGIITLRHGILRSGFILLLSVYSLYSLRAVYFMPYKENNRDAVAYVASEYLASDCCVFWPGLRSGAPSAYWLVYQRDGPGIRVVDTKTVEARRADCKRIWLVMDQTWWRNLDTKRLDLARQTLEQQYSQAARRAYFGSEVVLYGPKHE
jgi:mannosyltransferase